MDHRERRPVTMCAATMGGLMAIAASFAGLVSQVTTGGALSNTTGLTLILMPAAGALALARPRDVRVLTAATVLVTLSVLMELFGRLGPLYCPALILLVVGIARSDHVRRPMRVVPAATTAARPMLASEFDRRIRRAERNAPRRRATSPEALRRAG